MWLGIVSLMPEILAAGYSGGVVARAVSNGVLNLDVFNPRDFTHDRHKTVDDRPYGGGAGMVMMTEPLRLAVDAAKAKGPDDTKVVLLSPQGLSFDQQMAVEHSNSVGLILVCGRYEGVDQRFIESHIDEQWSIGDYVLSGGELPALVVMDAIARHVPGTLGNSLSIIDESHLDGMLDYPQYTRPVETEGAVVPEVLLSGNHSKVSEYRRREALQTTFTRRPDLLVGRLFDQRDRKLLQECFAAEQARKS
jgi:tRNA (guanine37-N1)-methyltransferase